MRTIVVVLLGAAFALTPATLCLAFWPKVTEHVVLVPSGVTKGCDRTPRLWRV